MGSSAIKAKMTTCIPRFYGTQGDSLPASIFAGASIYNFLVALSLFRGGCGP